jgi:hypothetical protein
MAEERLISTMIVRRLKHRFGVQIKRGYLTAAPFLDGHRRHSGIVCAQIKCWYNEFDVQLLTHCSKCSTKRLIGGNATSYSEY